MCRMHPVHFANTGNTANTNKNANTKTNQNCKLMRFTFGLNDPPQLDCKSDTIEEGRGKPDDDSDGNDDGNVDNDIYIMMQCMSQKIITSNFRAERRRCEVSRLLGLTGRRPALA